MTMLSDGTILCKNAISVHASQFSSNTCTFQFKIQLKLHPLISPTFCREFIVRQDLLGGGGGGFILRGSTPSCEEEQKNLKAKGHGWRGINANILRAGVSQFLHAPPRNKFLSANELLVPKPPKRFYSNAKWIMPILLNYESVQENCSQVFHQMSRNIVPLLVAA